MNILKKIDAGALVYIFYLLGVVTGMYFTINSSNVNTYPVKNCSFVELTKEEYAYARTRPDLFGYIQDTIVVPKMFSIMSHDYCRMKRVCDK